MTAICEFHFDQSEFDMDALTLRIPWKHADELASKKKQKTRSKIIGIRIVISKVSFSKYLKVILTKGVLKESCKYYP